MTRLNTLALNTMALLFLGSALFLGDAFGQQPTLSAQLVGTWTYVSVDTIRPDGSRVPMFGAQSTGGWRSSRTMAAMC